MRISSLCIGFSGLALGFVLAACSSPASQANAKYPPREEGCAVEVFPNNPPGQTENIGPVQATCDESVSNDDCMRTLKDQACKLGADIVWGVAPPELKLGKKHLSGRAVHTATSAPATSAPATSAPATSAPK